MSVTVLEAVTTRTIRSLQLHEGFVGAIEYQILDQTGAVFVDSTQHFNKKVNLKELALSSALLSQQGEPGYVEEEHRRRHVPVVTGYAVTKGHGDFPGLGWTVLVRMDHDAVLSPIRSVVFWKVGGGALAIWIPLLGLLLWATLRLRAEYRQAQQESAWARAAEAALLQSQERNRAIVDTALDGVITIDAAGVITDWNAQAAAIFGWSREEVLGQLLAETVIPERDRADSQPAGRSDGAASRGTGVSGRIVGVPRPHRRGLYFQRVHSRHHRPAESRAAAGVAICRHARAVRIADTGRGGAADHPGGRRKPGMGLRRVLVVRQTSGSVAVLEPMACAGVQGR